MKKPKILVVGSFVVDQIMTTAVFPKEGQTIIGKAFSKAPGGKGANQAVQMARLGAFVTMVGKLGEDANGREMLEVCKNAGLDMSRVVIDPDTPTACATIILEEKAGGTENRIIVYPGANMALCEEDVAFLKSDIAEYDIVVLQLEIPIEINLLIAKYAHEAGVPVFLNTAPYAPLPEELLPYLTYICPNETEAEGLTGINIPREGRVADIAVAKQAADVLLARGAKNVLITLGAAGAVLYDRDGELYSPSVEGIKAVDPTAAGDSFIGGFCYAITCGMDLERALQFANHTAAITVSRMGAIPSLPTLEQVKELLGEVSMKESCEKAYLHYIKTIETGIGRQIERMDYEQIVLAAALIRAAESNGGRIHISGIGKCAHVATYMASLFSSTGTPTYYLHGTESVHGSCGQLRENDLVIFISNSGETPEMKASVSAIKNNGCRIIGVSGNAESWLAKESNIHLLAKAEEEGGPMNRAPRMSIFAELMVLQALSVVLQDDAGVTPQQYVKWHPGGKLGEIRDSEK